MKERPGQARLTRPMMFKMFR